MTSILFYLEEYPHEPWKKALQVLEPSIEFLSYPNWGTAGDGPAYAVVWEPKEGLLKSYPNIKAVFSIGAGIDHILADTTIPAKLPIIRMGDDGLKEGMAEYILMNVLMHHRQMPHFLAQQRRATWRRTFAKPARSVRVGIMGYGALGKHAAATLKPLGYDIAAWSNSAKEAETSITHFTGQADFKRFLGRTDILVGLLPETEATTGLINAENLRALPKGASIINAGRGSLIDLTALISALDSNHLSAATLDVVPDEPLEPNHPLWHHEKVIITPHIAAITRTETAANYIIANIKRIEAGEKPQNMLNRNRGY